MLGAESVGVTVTDDITFAVIMPILNSDAEPIRRSGEWTAYGIFR